MLGEESLARAEAFTAAQSGLDVPCRAERADGDGLVVLTMSTTHRPEPFAGHDDAGERCTQVRARAAAPPAMPPPLVMVGARWYDARHRVAWVGVSLVWSQYGHPGPLATMVLAGTRVVACGTIAAMAPRRAGDTGGSGWSCGEHTLRSLPGWTEQPTVT